MATIETLPTNYKDDILSSSNERRKYNMITNSDGTVSFEDVTDYTQNGSYFGAGDHNATNSKVNEVISALDSVKPTVDTSMSASSTNAVQNKVIKSYADNILTQAKTYTDQHGGGTMEWADIITFEVGDGATETTNLLKPGKQITLVDNIQTSMGSSFIANTPYLITVDYYTRITRLSVTKDTAEYNFAFRKTVGTRFGTGNLGVMGIYQSLWQTAVYNGNNEIYEPMSHLAFVQTNPHDIYIGYSASSVVDSLTNHSPDSLTGALKIYGSISLYRLK